MGDLLDVDVRYEPDEDPKSVRVVVRTNDPELVGHTGHLWISAIATPQYSRVNVEKMELYKVAFPIKAEAVQWRIPKAKLRAFTYRGQHVHVDIETAIRVTGRGTITEIFEEQQQVELGIKPEVDSNAQQLMEPDDAFFFRENMKAIAWWNRVLVIVYLTVGTALVGTNTIVGIHDQFAPEAQTYVYTQRDRDGEPQSPLTQSLVVSALLAGIFWALIKGRLRRYMSFVLENVPARIDRSSHVRLADLLEARGRVSLKDFRIRVVAANVETGSYQRDLGTREITIRFEEPVRAVVLFDRHIDRWPAGRSLDTVIPDRVDFEPMFRILYPPCVVGLKVFWEIQLLHPRFVDQELVGPEEVFPYKEFLSA